MQTYNIAVLAGDGIGPEVMEVTLDVLEHVVKDSDFSVNCTAGAVGGYAIDHYGEALPQATIDLCKKSDAILFGSVGGPKWENLPPTEQPERAALLPLRKLFNLYANLRYIKIDEQMIDVSPLKREIIAGGVDLLIIRELTGDVYFGEPKKKEKDFGLDTMIYTREEVKRIAKLGFKIASERSGRLVSIDKANVLSSMVLWREVVTEVAKDFPQVNLTHMYVDNMSMQLVKNPKAFDVILCPNMFGDILSDEGAIITGSLGMLPSASLSEGGFGLYEPIGGTAPDIAGKNLANPIAQILSLALLLRHSLNKPNAAKKIENAVKKALGKGFRTGDLLIPGNNEGYKVVGTKEMGQAIITELN